MRLVPIVLALLAATASACRPPAYTSTSELQPGGEVSLQGGAMVRVLGTGLRVVVERIADSRCPVDVTCVTAGEARVALHLVAPEGERRDTLRLAGEPRAVRHGGLLVTLVDVRPLPRSTDTMRVPVAVLRVSTPE